MEKCRICNKDISVGEDGYLTLYNVPENTFNFSENTIDLNILNCSNCGAVQLYNVLISEDYDIVYRSIGVSSDYREEKKKQLANFILAYNLYDKNVIEVGCGDGQFLEIFKELGLNCSGIEGGEANSKKCVENGYNVFYGNVYSLGSQIYDAFCTFYFLEHTPYPIQFIQNLYRILKPDGIGLIEVPCYDSIEKNNIWLEFTKDHRFYFRKRTLLYALIKCGFDIESINVNEEKLCLSVIVKKPKNNGNFESIRNKINTDVESFKNLINKLNGNFAIFGAGHYSQMLLGQIDIKPKHIFDSNKQKCGNKLNGVLIEHKDDITKSNDFDNLIIICGTYNDEVYKMLLKNEQLKLKEIVKWD